MTAFTEAQQAAITTVGCSVAVTAAAGSGKTAVLTERCAHLVCDLPPQQRCRVDELLVVTFTEAAAAEMKSRILDAIRDRARRRPDDPHLRQQAALIDTAQISTLHAFCLWMLRRWFSQANIDPLASPADADEVRLLRQDTINQLFSNLYADQSDLGRGFVRLVDEYGLGKDRALAETVLSLADFLRSLPEPARWIDRARARVGASVEETVVDHLKALRLEIASQCAHLTRSAEYLGRGFPEVPFYAKRIRELADALERWSGVGDYETLRAEVLGFDLNFRGAPRMGKTATEEARRQRQAAAELATDLRDRLLKRNLQRRVRFTESEMHAGLTAIRPHAEALLDLTAAFAERYEKAKQKAGILDFADLERGAYQLLKNAENPSGPSDIARELHARFAHVLVDEFQDTNPLQEAILRQVSREADADRPDNLFCVGDVKQSIYRFRLAEPQVFQDRIDRAMQPDTPDVCVHLQENFRSCPSLLAGINLVFEPLMTRELGGVDYDESARLRPGLEPSEPGAGPPIELHILERRLEPHSAADDDGEPPGMEPSDPATWTVIQREAYLIGQRLRALQAEGFQVDGRPLQWGDVAVLLRAAQHSAGPVVEQLRRLGIPAVTTTGGGLLDATEVRDVIALLNVLDNPQQEIPLAAVLRSGVTGLRFNEDDLVAIRRLNRGVPFHEAVRDYVNHGESAELGERLGRFRDRIDRWRRDVRRRPLAEGVWSIYRQSGYLAYVGGLSSGSERRANLLALHERTRQFGTFTRQGLHRFLRFLESLEALGRDLGPAPPSGQLHDAVTVITIHHSKGLEYPVVCLADLGRRFNLTDARGDIIFERRVGVGLRVVDPSRMIKYPSILHGLVARGIEAATRDEELRVLYVALTRAKQRLILVGSAGLAQVTDTRDRGRLQAERPSAMQNASAGTPLDWLIPVLSAARDGLVCWSDSPSEPPPQALIQATLHTEDEMNSWLLERAGGDAEKCAHLSVARLAPLPASEPRVDDFSVQPILEQVRFTYPHLAASSVRSAVAVSEAKRLIDPFADEHRPAGRLHNPATFDPPAILAGPSDGVTSRQRGTVTHRALEHLRFDCSITDELQRLVEAQILTPQDAGMVDTDALAWFVDTPLGQRVCQAGDAYRREFVFISSEPADLFDPTLGGGDDEQVLVRGIVDGVLPGPDGVEIVDFKTDAVDAGAVEARAARYAVQMRLYARAAERLWRRPVTGCWLVFLTPRCVYQVPQEQYAS